MVLRHQTWINSNLRKIFVYHVMMRWFGAAEGRRQHQFMPSSWLLISLIHLKKHANEIALLFNRFYARRSHHWVGLENGNRSCCGNCQYQSHFFMVNIWADRDHWKIFLLKQEFINILRKEWKNVLKLHPIMSQIDKLKLRWAKLRVTLYLKGFTSKDGLD